MCWIYETPLFEYWLWYVSGFGSYPTCVSPFNFRLDLVFSRVLSHLHLQFMKMCSPLRFSLYQGTTLHIASTPYGPHLWRQFCNLKARREPTLPHLKNPWEKMLRELLVCWKLALPLSTDLLRIGTQNSWSIMTCRVILHNMIIEDERGQQLNMDFEVLEILPLLNATAIQSTSFLKCVDKLMCS